MTNPGKREQSRAVRAYQREHPGMSLDEARKAVAARAGRRLRLPDRIPAAPLPRPGERLEGYVRRVAARLGVQQHRAMELLGLEPGTSASQRLEELDAGLPERTVRALCAATGMALVQARGLSGPASVANDVSDLQARARQVLGVLDAKSFRRGGQDKTTTEAPELARLLAQSGGQRILMMDMDPPQSLGWPSPALDDPFLVDLPWPADGRRLPAAGDLVDNVLTELGITPSHQSVQPERGATGE
ncbi:hypothetical protein OG730_41795 (plasmid) [Streptomyces sp. NBC_01298]|uniref:hypothetical protein n=1 Tax=Streptomyces sp. NBC_01298 TaxID=2903817 RepID=UPI002E0F587A|nr:hypothetical protein OG730_41795 [Streptomyces sp. NBC_01298]